MTGFLLQEQIVPLFTSVRSLLAPDGAFILAYARRNVKIDSVFATARDMGFGWSVLDSSQNGENIYEFKKLT